MGVDELRFFEYNHTGPDGSFVKRISLGGILTFFSCLLGVATNNLHCIMIPHSVGQVSIEPC